MINAPPLRVVAFDDNERVRKQNAHGFSLVARKVAPFLCATVCHWQWWFESTPIIHFSKWLDTQVFGPGPW
jgi:hypothetical protein